MHALAAGFMLQARTFRSNPDALMPLFTAPLFAVVFLAIVRHADRDDLTAYAVLAPVLIALWWLAITQAGGIVEGDRWQGVIEAAIATPSSFPAVVLGRVLAVTILGLTSFVEVWLVATFAFRVGIEIHHPSVLALTLAATTLAMAGTSVIIAAVFVLTRTATTLVNSLNWPFYVLGGVLVPVAFLPDWIEPVSRAVFLSWSSDLLRASLDPAPVEDLAARLGMIVLLGLIGFAIGQMMLERFLRSVRHDGTLGHT